MGLLDDFFKRDKDKEQDPPDFSKVQGGGSSTAPAPATADANVKAAARTYTVVKGDSLSKIAKQYYGSANKWRQIYEANRDVIKDPDLIYPGQSLRIPEA
jgi:nucleoid-associated protein YgaU